MKCRSFRRVFAYINLWGLRLTLFKVLGRLRLGFIRFLPLKKRNILVIGCGQFAFSSLMPNLLKNFFFSPIRYAYDIDKKNMITFCKTFRCEPLDDILSFSKKEINLAYICSSHSSHFEYTQQLLKSNINVYCEKPLTTSIEQVYELYSIIKQYNSKIYAGYNRPHSPLITNIKERFLKHKPNNLNILCSIYGHYLENNHWYRDPNQGSRIYGNLSHWIDLANHIMNWPLEKPKMISIEISYLDDKYQDENLICILKSSNSITMNLNFYALFEPFLGVHETIEFSSNCFNARINNFKKLKLESKNEYKNIRYSQKNAGHRQAISQPISNEYRDPREFLMSEILTYYIWQMTLNKNTFFELNYEKEYEKLNKIY